MLWFCSLPAPAGQTATPQGECAIEGRVVDAVDGRPIPDAHISVSYIGPAYQRYTNTNADGRFAVGNLKPGRFYIWVSHPGYIAWGYGQRSFRGGGGVVSILPSQQLKDLVISLNPVAVVAGRVAEGSGKALGGVSVQALREMYWDGRRQWDSVGSTATNMLGEYRMEYLTPGCYYISATDLTGYGTKSAPKKARVPFYYPGFIDPTRATKIDLRPGTEMRADITLPEVRVISVRGRIINALTSKPALRANVSLSGRLSDIPFYAGNVSVDAGRGTFEISGLVPGTYTLFAKEQIDELHDRWISGWKLLEVGETDIEGVSLSMSPGARVTGRIRVEGGTKVNYTHFSVILDPRDDVIDTEGGDPLERVKRDGTFVFKDVLSGTYDVRLDGEAGNYYLKSAMAGGQELLVTGLRVSPPDAPSPLELTIGAGAGQIDGVVLDYGQPMMLAAVVLIPDHPNGNFPATASTNEAGRFALRGIAPGDYELFAWDDVERVGYRSADLLRPYKNRAVPVHMAKGGKLRLNLQLIPASIKCQSDLAEAASPVYCLLSTAD